jgi:hypothetical protein
MISIKDLTEHRQADPITDCVKYRWDYREMISVANTYVAKDDFLEADWLKEQRIKVVELIARDFPLVSE